MPSLPPDISSAVRDPFGDAWTSEQGLLAAALANPAFDVPRALSVLSASMDPAPRGWMVDRLTLLWATFNASREAEPRALATWMAETARLLADIPHDILAHSVDTAIKGSRHGFMPSIGEIRGYADPLIDDRRTQLARLAIMAADLADTEKWNALNAKVAGIRAMEADEARRVG